jgi:C1A family cysteine protease
MKKYLVPLFFVLLSCGEHSFDDLEGTLQDVLGTGLESSNLEEIPQDIKSFSNANASSFPRFVSLENKFPPVQTQGQYGTCAVWSTGYAFKTALNAIDKNWSPADLAKPSNQTSPKDLWIAVPSDKKGKGCWATSFEYAMDVLIAKGVASMAVSPYNMENSCDNSPSTAKGDPNNKLANYRKIAYNYALCRVNSDKKEGMDIDNFKSYLAQGRPVLFAGDIGLRFDSWNSSAVISSDSPNPRLSPGNGHAMVLSGYDDERRAFRVRNSWGDNWGDKGSIWVDYDYFVNRFCMYAFVAQNHSSPDNSSNNQPASDSYDLLANFAEDYPDPENKTNPRARAFSYFIYNNGAKDILASQKWSVY